MRYLAFVITAASLVMPLTTTLATTAFAQAPAQPVQRTSPAPQAQQPGAAQQAGPSQLRVIVVDQTGAGIPGVTVRVTRADGSTPIELTGDDRGVLAVPALAVGPVQLHVEAGGFAPVDTAVTLRRGANNQTITLAIAGVQEEVVVSDATADDRRGNSLTTTLEQSDIEELSDDPDELAAQLEQMTGGAGAVFQVDGFRGGRLPSRDQIRQIRFRTNSFSADNHDAGRVLVEIVTRPGLTAWSGNANFGLRNNVLTARNAFAKTQTPEQYRRFTLGMCGPLVKNRTSLRLNVDGNRSFDTGTIFAQTVSGDFTGVVRRPVEATNVTVALEHGLTRNQTLRFEYRRSNSENRNQGVGDLSLPERAFTRTRDEDQVRGTLQSVLGRASLNEFRVQWNGTDSGSVSQTLAPTVIVIDAFSSGGAGQANETSNRTWDVSDDLDFTVKKHAMRAGFRLEGGAYRQFDARNQFGTFTFGSLESLLAGLPTTYTQRVGQVPTAFDQYQLGAYWQDDFRINRNLSLSIGLRQELQTHMGDKVNLMPRFGYTWNPFGWKTTLRGGYGIFYDWYDTNLYDQTLRVNGVDQGDLLVLNPGYPDPLAGALGTVLAGGRVQADPKLSMPYVHQASIGLERPLSASLTLQASVSMQRGRDQLRSRNINAPNELGVRPQPTVGTITQIESTGRSTLDRLTLGFNYRVPKYRMFMNSNYTLARAENFTDNPLNVPANSLNPDLDWGPSSQDVRHRFTTMFNFPLPFAVRANINANASSGAPYTITTGRDDNGDGVTNDRPAGVGRNSARGQARVELGMRISRGFGFGGSPASAQAGAAPGPGAGPGGLPAPPPGGGQVLAQGPGGPGGGGPGGGGPGGGGPGGGGPPDGGGGGGFFGGAQTNQRFNVEFYAQALNLLNRTNYINFSGNMLSRTFLTPTSASQARRVEVGMQFRF